MRTIFLPTMEAMNSEGRSFKGCLYFGLMLTGSGPKVIEYNCRFGDPETQVVLPLLEGDLVDIMLATRNGTLSETPVRFKDGAACCVVVASGGYPQSYGKGYPISLPEPASRGAEIFVAGARLEGETLVTNGGRVLGVTGVAPSLDAAIDKAYEAAGRVRFEKAYYRRDIGKRALGAKTIRQG
jgi:phosphoribosylamine--glycine ligase